MNNEQIKEMCNDIYEGGDWEPMIDYITNLQKENERLKTKLNCKEYFSATMPEDTEFVILTKENYDRQEKDIQLELIDYKSRCEKAIEYIMSALITEWDIKNDGYVSGSDLPVDSITPIIDILNGCDEK